MATLQMNCLSDDVRAFFQHDPCAAMLTKMSPNIMPGILTSTYLNATHGTPQ